MDEAAATTSIIVLAMAADAIDELSIGLLDGRTEWNHLALS
jgi:hypothetical protein